jgi:hypothetical protein
MTRRKILKSMYRDLAFESRSAAGIGGSEDMNFQPAIGEMLCEVA